MFINDFYDDRTKSKTRLTQQNFSGASNILISQKSDDYIYH